MMNAHELRQRADRITWWHGGIDLGHGIITRGKVYPGNDLLPAICLPSDMQGLTVLDIGTWDGFMAWECERRGARVTAVDSFVWDKAKSNIHENYTGRDGFDLAHEAIGSQVVAVTCEVLDLAPENLGTFDIVLFLGVLYHMRHPLLALERAAEMVKPDGLLILESHVDMIGNSSPAMRFYPGRELAGDRSNWWGPNPACITAMLHDVGFDDVKQVSMRGTRIAMHGRRHNGQAVADS